LLEREKRIFESGQDEGFQPDFAGKEYILERQLKPEACIDTIKYLREKNIVPTAIMDVSDGLSSELLHICKASGVGCRVYEDKLPIDYATASMCDEFNMNLTTVALNGGEDYELLFTVPLSEHEKLQGLEGVHIIGHITDANAGSALVTRDGKEIRITAQGWNAFKSEEEK
jgi:thiamine-monophosphate kinase